MAEAAPAGAATPRGAEGVLDPLWDDWTVPPRVPVAPELHLEGFDGPLDLLLDLAERQRIDLGRVAIVALAEQFVAALTRLIGYVPLERCADWLVMASRLLLLRSRLLLPKSPEAAAAAARDAAAEANRLEEMAFLRQVATWLQARPQLGIDVFARPEPAPSRDSGYVALMEACLAVLRGNEGRPAVADVYQPKIPKLWRVQDALERIRLLLAVRPEGGALEEFLPPLVAEEPERPLKIRAAIASTLVAGLELARERSVHMEQAKPFGEITLRGTEAPAVGAG